MSGAKVALKANVEMQKPESGRDNEVVFHVYSKDNTSLTGNQILEAISEAILLYWDNCPMEARNEQEFDS